LRGNGVCANKSYKDMTIGEFLKNCGTDPIPKDVAVKYCYLGIQYEDIEMVTDFSIHFSGWEGEEFDFDTNSVQ